MTVLIALFASPAFADAPLLNDADFSDPQSETGLMMGWEAPDDLFIPDRDINPVVGGYPSPEGNWPDAAGIIFRDSYVGCTGVLIHERAVLTAGHCVGGITGVVLNATNYYRDGDIVDVEQTIEYPQSQRTYDLAVLILAEEAPKHVKPRQMVLDCIADDDLVNGAEVSVVGYGATREDGRGSTSTLMEGQTFVQDADCNQQSIDGIWSGCNWSVSPGGELGAGGNGVDACFGDSGGPLYLMTDHGDYLAGITSRAYAGVPRDTPCRDGGIYVRPDAVIDWIEEQIGDTVKHPSCNDKPEVEAAPIKIGADLMGQTRIQGSDPDGEIVGYKVVGSPAHGSATVDAKGNVHYTAGFGFRGSDTVTIAVTDDGSEYEASGPNTVELVIDVKGMSASGATLGKGAGCGCSTGSTPGSMAWLLALGLPWLRRRNA